ncbi:MAG: WG repeat-containing protein [Sphingobacteriales bacterium]|nr:MAG: WG repeat-containing protein [Sphingobacteriales bacterium]
MQRLIFLVFLLVQFSACYAQDYELFKKKGRVGFKDRSGKIVIEPLFDQAWDTFSMGVVGVKKEDKWGYIDSTGRQIVAFKYDEVGNFNPVVKLAIVFRDGKAGYINRSGREIIPVIYDDLEQNFYENLVSATKNNKSGCINTNGKTVIPFVYETQNIKFRNSVAIVKERGKYGLIDKENKKIIPLKYDEIVEMEDVYRVKTGAKFGLVNKTGKELISCQYDNAIKYAKNIYALTSGDKTLYVNSLGEKTDKNGKKL